jgi:oxalate decarboxylase/phosphoglucose isomerase-like protein (cupin superfamily)
MEKDYEIAHRTKKGCLVLEVVMVKPGGIIPLHTHPVAIMGCHKTEAYVWQSGSGEVTIDDQTLPFGQLSTSKEGEVTIPFVTIPPSTKHGVKNLSATEPLLFLAIFHEPTEAKFATIFAAEEAARVA